MGLTQYDPEYVARMFHDNYEQLAPNYGYETRADTKQFDPESPNGKLMIECCRRVLEALTPICGCAAGPPHDPDRHVWEEYEYDQPARRVRGQRVVGLVPA